MASDDEGESLAHFLESEILSELSDQENLETREEEDDNEEEETSKKRLHVEEGELSEQEEKDRQEAKKIRIEEGEISDEGLSRAVRSSTLLPSLTSLELEAEIEAALSPPEVICDNNNNGGLSTESRQLPRKIETGLFSQITPRIVFSHPQISLL